MAIEASSVRELRDRTSAGFLDCKNALEEANGDFEKAGEILRKKGLAKAMKKGSRGTPEGRVGSYIHTNGKLGVLVEINCETDFVAKNDVFADLIKDICMHIAATDPMAVSRETVPQEMIDRERKAYNEEFKDKPDNVRDKIIDGKMESFYKEVCLVNQSFVKDNDKTIEDLLKNAITKLGENIKISRFARFAIGE
ncbi:MAG: translation elongation factor Ts [Candidatus Scalindua sp.]|jgi:elongation factor Ts|nr:translation elongation factor Ts [Candidatus Scalindua sp.]MBT5304573.1 translation elongation factor Ts [Candidatus Scalindua sp.]MBT6053357.1 translation elongation factor Ts [Candidatus Scalindua sp.]MBT6226254.1 translation elongation factor Ts [Candidatus Scalindua sp.]MBT6561298.1 translation elongation factor Ts [Candidatus Scalindua sp.]